MVSTLLSRSSLQNVAHGNALTTPPALGVLRNRVENDGADCKERTFAWLLREGTLRARQTWQGVEIMPPGKLEERELLRKGV